MNLYEEEARGGHAISRHVRRSDANLLADVRFAPIVPPLGRSFREIRVGSFASIEAANDFVNRTLEENRAAVDAVMIGDYNEMTVMKRFGYVTGREAVRDMGSGEVALRNTYGVKVILQRDTRAGRGYRVLTAYPAND